jgi:tRNA1Val (adenine37-N6)-methyltransferase
MLAQKLPVAQIDTIEVDEEACQQAKENIAASPFVSKINVLHADVREFSFDTGYDVIISNPPFYEKEIISADQKKNVAHHASTLTIEELLKIIKTCLRDDGIFYLLLPFKRNEEIKKKISQQNLLVSKLVFVKQSLQHNYFRIMIKGKLNWGDDRETSVGEISICNDGQQYSEDFKILLKDYYLHL